VACKCRSADPCSRQPSERSWGRALGWLGQRSERKVRVLAEFLYSYSQQLGSHVLPSACCGQVPRTNLGVTLADMLTTAAIFGGLSVLGRLCLEECHTPFTTSLRMSLHCRKSSAAGSQYQLSSIWKRICFTQDIAVSVPYHNNV
jgi:hypothetical protein